jgi:hypothetical protein
MMVVFKKSSNDFSKAKLFPLPVAELSYNEKTNEAKIIVKNQDLQDKWGITESSVFQDLDLDEEYDLSVFHTFLDGEGCYDQTITATGEQFMSCFNDPSYVYKVHSPPYIQFTLHSSK